MTTPPIQSDPASFDPVELIRAMVAIPSLSTREQAIASFLVEQMRVLGFDAHVDEAGNAVGIRTGTAPADSAWRDVVLLGHMDTVPGAIPVRIEGGILHGRGSVDAKGPLATFVAAAAFGAVPAGTRWIVIGATEEEAASSRGARHARDAYRPAMCVIGEPSGVDAVVLGYKGRMIARYRAAQPGGHSAGPHGGVAESAVAWWNGVRAHADAFNVGRERLFDQILPSLLDLNTVSDGLEDVATATASLRLPQEVDVEALERALHDAAGGIGEVRCEGRERAYLSSRSSALANAFGRAFAARDIRPAWKVKTGTADMNVVGPTWACPMVAYGPGDSTLDHTPHEHLVLDEYLRAIDILRDVLESL